MKCADFLTMSTARHAPRPAGTADAAACQCGARSQDGTDIDTWHATHLARAQQSAQVMPPEIVYAVAGTLDTAVLRARGLPGF